MIIQKLKIIAEIANAHQGDIDTLKTLIIASAESGADAVKFQWFKYDYLATPDFNWYSVYKNLFISEDNWKKMLNLARDVGLEIWVDIFDEWGLKLANKHSSLIDGIKIPTTIIQAEKLVEEILKLNKPIMLGVGGWYDKEIDSFIKLLKDKMINKTKIVLMHGFQGYPTKTEDANLNRINYLKNKYQLPVGFADHEDGSRPLAIDLPMYAACMGAIYIEKHITLDRSKKGYDYYSSLEPEEFSLMVSKLHQLEVILGGTEVGETQRNYLKDAVRVVSSTNIKKGQVLSSNQIVYKRCEREDALMPWDFKKMLPCIATEDISKDKPVLSTMIRKPTIVIVVICRLKSTRLQRKALLKINGIPSIQRCLINCLAIPNISSVVLATSDLPEDDPLEQFSLSGRVKVVRGDPENVARRMIKAVKLTNADIVLRITGDCPAVSPEIVSLLIEEHLKSGKDFTTATSEHAIGTAADVITVESLKRLLNRANKLIYTEYLSFYYYNNPSIFSVNLVKLPEKYQFPNWRLTLDEVLDLEMFEALYKGLELGEEPLYFELLRNYLIYHPEIIKLNENVSLLWKDNVKKMKEINRATILE
ncbi:N-acetylneuraminate synthase family protein [Bacillus sp. FJAT-45350]|uniref:N-acetylneuraminate synthase family protein n=1 Tax=Bacillus sp. FJAT-45350 TaxID=2011014 RepID=UPI000BB90896|nr:N-acetylneuraminate synthase family protein [Bacillus sp. FJAT-45350]